LRAQGIRILLLAIALLIASASSVFAHSPHDEIELVRLSSNFWLDGTVFVIARDALMASFDAAVTWQRLTQGLPYVRLRSFALSSRFPSERRVVVASERGIHFSDDAGHSWRPSRIRCGTRFDAGLGVRESSPRPFIKLISDANPRSDSMLCIMGDTLLATHDQGSSWNEVSGLGIERYTAICIGDEVAYAAGGSGDVVAFRVHSQDVEVTGRWRLNTNAPVSALALGESSQLLAGTLGSGIWELRRGLEPTQLGVRHGRITDICVCREYGRYRPGAATGLFATEWTEGVYASPDGGATWRRSSRGLSRDRQADEASFRVPHFKCIDRVEQPEGRGVLFVGGFDGLFRSTENGTTWREIENVVDRRLIVGLALSSADAQERRVAVSLYGAGVRIVRQSPLGDVTSDTHVPNVRTFAIARPATANRDTWVASHDRVIVIPDGVKRPRTVVLQHRERRPSIASRFGRTLKMSAKRAFGRLPAGIRSNIRSFVPGRASVLGIVIDVDVFGSVLRLSPAFSEDGTALLSTRRNGIFVTTDAGRTFRHLGSLPSGAWTLSLDLSPRFGENGRFYVAAEDGLWVGSVRGDRWTHHSSSQLHQGVLRIAAACTATAADLLLAATAQALLRGNYGSGDDHTEWRPVLDCNGGFVVTEIVPAPDLVESGIVFVHQAGVGILRSVDGGLSFAPVLSGDRPFARECALQPSFPDSAPLIAVSPRFSRDGVAYAASGTELFVSRDRGATWGPWHSFVDNDVKTHRGAG